MKKNLLITIFLLLSAVWSWAQPVAGNPVTTALTVPVCTAATTVDIPVTVDDFAAVGSIALKLAYTNTAINSPSVVYLDPGVVAWNNFQINTGTPGIIIISAYDPNTVSPTGLTLDDGEILFTLHFTIGTIVDNTALTFVENSQGTSCEYGGIGPDYTPFIDTPTEDYYIAGGVDVIDFVPGAIAAEQFICEGEDVAAFTSGPDASGEGTITYQWQMSTTSGSAGFSNIDGATSSIYNPGTITVDTWYRRIATATLGETACSQYSNVLKVTVINFVPGDISADQFICEGNDVAAFSSSTNASGDGTITYQWQLSTTGGSGGFSNIDGAESSTYNPGTITVDTWYRRAATAADGGTSCTENSNAVKVTVINFVPGNITADQFICEGDDVAAFSSSPDASGDGTITYQWQLSTTSSSADFGNIDGATSPAYNPGAITVDTWYRRAATAGQGGTSCTEYSNTVKVTVINFVPGVIAADQFICEGNDLAAFSSSTNASGDGAITNQWQLSTTSGSADFNNIDGATSPTYDPGAITVDTWYRRAATAVDGGTSCTEYSNAVKVTVINFVPGVIAADQFICEGDDVAAFSSNTDASGDGTIICQWQLSTTSASADFNNIEGATSPAYNPGTITVDTWYRRAATAGQGGTSCTEYSNAVKVTVINFVPGVIAADQFICEGNDVAAFSSSTNASGDGTITNQWQLSTTSGSADFNNIDGATFPTYDPGAITADTWYRRAATAADGGTSCTEYSNAVKVTVINFVPGAISNDQLICENEDVVELSSVPDASGDGTITYQWQLSTTGESTGFSNIGGAASETYDPGTINVDTWYRRAATAELGGTSCTEYSNAVWVRVLNFIPGAITSDQTICSGYDAAAFTNVSAASGEGAFTYKWQVSTTSGSEGFDYIEGATANNYDPGNIFVDTWYRREATSTLEPLACLKYSNVLKVTANQRKTISGTFNYYNLDGNILLSGQDITVELYQTSDLEHETQLATTQTDASGNYSFTALCPACEYDIVATSTHTTDGSINTTDAAQVNYRGVHFDTPIEKVRFYAGDVGTSGEDQNLTINSTDAGRIQRHFVYQDAFDRPWTFWKAGFTITGNTATESYPSVNLPVGNDVDLDMYGLCTGDYNRSFNPYELKSGSSALDLVYAGNRQMNSNQEFELPLRMANACSVGAISLILNFPADLVEVPDIVMNGSEGQLDWTVKGNELRIGWNSPVPLYLSEDAILLTLKLKTTAAFTEGNSINLTLASSPLNELADEYYNVIGDAVIRVEVINASALGIDDKPAVNTVMMTNYPNPFSDFTIFDYTLPFNGRVNLEVNSILGNRVALLVNEMQAAGNHKVKFDTNGLPSGLYMATLRLRSANDELVRTIKVIINK